MKVYLAARYQEHPTMRDWRAALADAGIEVTSRWINGEHELDGAGDDEQKRRFAREDLEDIIDADAVVLWNPREHFRSGRGGSHVEVGYAIARGKPIILVGERENVFHWCPGVSVVKSLSEAIEVLQLEASRAAGA